MVTGAAAGIGAAVAQRLGREGFQLVLVDKAETIHEVASGWAGMDVLSLQVDLTEAEQRKAIPEAVSEFERPLRVLVNNAGITKDARLVNMTRIDFDAVVAVNLGAAFLLTIELVGLMSTGGAVVNMSSRSYLGNFGQFNYSLSKGGLVGMTRALALDLAPEIRVNAVAPGLVATGMTLGMPHEVLQRLVAAVPMGRMAKPSEIADLVAFLVSDQSSYVTGGVHIIGGGRSLR